MMSFFFFLIRFSFSNICLFRKHEKQKKGEEGGSFFIYGAALSGNVRKKCLFVIQ